MSVSAVALFLLLQLLRLVPPSPYSVESFVFSVCRIASRGKEDAPVMWLITADKVRQQSTGAFIL